LKFATSASFPVRWFLTYCFDLAGDDASTLCQIRILDNINSPLSRDRIQRWYLFGTPKVLVNVGDILESTEVRLDYGDSHRIVVSQMTRDIDN
jgi:hypothetical protein